MEGINDREYEIKEPEGRRLKINSKRSPKDGILN